MPMLTPTETGWPSSSNGSARTAMMLRASRAAPSVSAVLRMTANSSPPSLATSSCLPAQARRRPAAACRRASPMGWPSVSLTDLKPSRSRHSIAVPAVSSGRDSAISRRLRNCTRLGSPVSASCSAMWLSRASALRRSVMSSNVSTQPPPSIVWRDTATTRPSGSSCVKLALWSGDSMRWSAGSSMTFDAGTPSRSPPNIRAKRLLKTTSRCLSSNMHRPCDMLLSAASKRVFCSQMCWS